MKVWKLVAGIFSIVLSVIVLFQSCAAGVVDAIEDQGGTSGSAGLIVAIVMLAGGIVSIATRSSQKKGASIALLILFGIGAVTGLAMHGIYTDLIIWGVFCLINAILALINIITVGKNQPAL